MPTRVTPERLPVDLAGATWAELRDAKYQVALLPWGATEAHNTHLPYATDTISAERVARAAAESAAMAGAKVVVLPAIPYGVQTGQRELPLCINLDPSTQASILRNIAESVAGAAIPKLVVVNGHGGNDFRQMIRELQGALPLLIAQVNWYQVVDPRPFFTVPGDHAGELETSVMQHLAPGLVQPLTTAGDGATKSHRIAGFREGWAWTPRRWVEVSTDTGVGDPRAASAEKGEKYLAAVTAKLGAFLSELAATDPTRLYE
jgi:creatinine amidohydrolase